MRVYRTLVVGRKLTKEEFAKLKPLLRRVSALVSLWARGHAVFPPDLRYFAKEAAAIRAALARYNIATDDLWEEAGHFAGVSR